MAIVQISRITNRKGLTENLPQLAGAELGWCVDSRRLFIGNGTLQSGAPVIGNTEILTEFSDITVLADYTYSDIVVGYAAQTGPTPSDPVVRSVQAKLDDFASVRDFGATGDGTTDDTAAINRALFQLYCRENNTQVRRALYFPAGTYRVTETIIIPTYAKLVGEGADCSIIRLILDEDESSIPDYVARYGDSRQQIGVNIGNGGAVPPRNIEISSMTFQSDEDIDVFLVQDAEQCWFESTNFIGSLTAADIEDSIIPDPDISLLRFSSTAGSVCTDIVFDRCGFYNSNYAINTNTETKGITISNSGFRTLNQAINLSQDASGFRVVHNAFDEIFGEALVFNTSLNVSGYNVFYNVGQSIGSTNAQFPVIRFGSDNNVSVGDMFERSVENSVTEPPVVIVPTVSSTGSSRSQLGRYVRELGRTFTLANNVSNQPIFNVSALQVRAFNVQYTITRANETRTGMLQVASQPSDGSTITQVFSDDYTETFDVGITLSVVQVNNTVTVRYSSTNTGATGTLTYSISHLA
jgi:hypothetical protein